MPGHGPALLSLGKANLIVRRERAVNVFRRLAAQWAERYRKMSIQMVLSLTFTAVAAAGMLLMSVSLIWRFPPSTSSWWRKTAAGCWPRPI